MSLKEPRCLVCGNPLDRGAPFKKDVRNSEVCSDKCYAIYMTGDLDATEDYLDEMHRLGPNKKWKQEKSPSRLTQ